jgi:hypothetical protein
MGASKLSASADFVRYVAQAAARERSAAAAEKAARVAAAAAAQASRQAKSNWAAARAMRLKRMQVWGCDCCACVVWWCCTVDINVVIVAQASLQSMK